MPVAFQAVLGSEVGVEILNDWNLSLHSYNVLAISASSRIWDLGCSLALVKDICCGLRPLVLVKDIRCGLGFEIEDPFFEFAKNSKKKCSRTNITSITTSPISYTTYCGSGQGYGILAEFFGSGKGYLLWVKNIRCGLRPLALIKDIV